MSSQLKRILLITSLTISFVILLVIINQVVQLSQSIGYLHPTAGYIFMVLAFGVILSGFIMPIVLYLRLPSPLIPPIESAGQQIHDDFKAKLRKRLLTNPNLSQPIVLATDSDVVTATNQLNTLSTKHINRTAKRAFYTTAISQNGALDALFMLALQFKLIWDVAHVYSQRPTLRDMGFLYSNVMITAFIAAQLDEAEYLEMIETAITTGIGSAVSLVPGTSIIVNSALSGASNTFLTLRVGIIAQRYCNARVRPERRTLRNSATAQAARMMGTIVAKGTTDLVSNMSSAPFRKWFGWGRGAKE